MSEMLDELVTLTNDRWLESRNHRSRKQLGAFRPADRWKGAERVFDASC